MVNLFISAQCLIYMDSDLFYILIVMLSCIYKMLEIIFIGLCSESTKSQSTQLFYSSFVQIIITFIIITFIIMIINLFICVQQSL